MSLIYNIEPNIADLVFTEGDTINMTFNVTENDLPFDMSGYDVDIMVRYFDDRLIKHMTSIGSPACISVGANSFTINCDGFTEHGIFIYDVQLSKTGEVRTIMSGYLKVIKQITI